MLSVSVSPTALIFVRSGGECSGNSWSLLLICVELRLGVGSLAPSISFNICRRDFHKLLWSTIVAMLKQRWSSNRAAAVVGAWYIMTVELLGTTTVAAVLLSNTISDRSVSTSFRNRNVWRPLDSLLRLYDDDRVLAAVFAGNVCASDGPASKVLLKAVMSSG